MLIGCLGGIIVKVLKGTGREGFLLKLWIAWIWGPWVAPPASEGALCFTDLLHAAFHGTFSNNQKAPFGTLRIQAPSRNGESICANNRHAFGNRLF